MHDCKCAGFAQSQEPLYSRIFYYESTATSQNRDANSIENAFIAEKHFHQNVSCA